MAYAEIESYKTPDGGECVLLGDEALGRWKVQMWTAEEECHWELTGWNEGGVSDGFRTVGATWHDYTEETARKEFERWRK